MLVGGSWHDRCAIACMQCDFGHNVLCSASVACFVNEENNSYVSLSQNFRARISYGHMMCFIHMQAVHLCCRKANLWSQGICWVSAALAKHPQCRQPRCLGWQKALSKVGGFSVYHPRCPQCCKCDWCLSTTRQRGASDSSAGDGVTASRGGQASAPLCSPCHGGVAGAAQPPRGEPPALRARVEGFGCGSLSECWFI